MKNCISRLCTHPLVSLEVFNCSPQPLKAGIVATALSRRFMEFSMYGQRCIIAGTVVACCVCVLIPFLPPVFSPCTLANPKKNRMGPGRQGPCAYSRIHGSALHVHMPRATRHPGLHL